MSQRNAIVTYGLLILIWSSTPLAIVWSTETIPALWAMVIRFFLAAPLAMLLLLIFKTPIQLDKQACLSYLAGSLSLIGSQFFTYLATEYLSSGMIALMFGLSPMIAGLIGVIWFNIHLSGLQWFGMLVSLIGLASVCLLAQQSMHFSIFGIILMLLSVSVYCSSIYFVKKIAADVKPFVQATGSIVCSSLLALLLIPFIWHDLPVTLPSFKSMFAVAYTVIIASLLAMFCYFKLVQNISATTISLTNVLTPILALVVGVTLNHEHLSVSVYFGVAVIFFGLALYFWRDIQMMLRQRLDRSSIKN
ncbi:EamA family transporter [Acinetobacter qingfengensis]|uniref:EamA domain-containing protein n=1 Tax=Acinetobacter qingfengensis TaxID=1262585 RepID=A0A1E7RFY8_9GAMM|nr:EamA family transporter [Acinetobacter qingfengensis]KAA8731926.1 EamA family transporter [Acinetobacter qingfengensis]OEY98216.1 hypothetical protein BJI46_00585 [Acinetobacter qingfengensis]